MFRRKTKRKSSFLALPLSNRGSDIVRPDNTSLIVNESDTETDDFPKELTSIFSEDEDDNVGCSIRQSSSLMRSLSQKKQSTPLSQALSANGALTGQGNSSNRLHKSKEFRSLNKTPFPSDKENTCYFEEVIKAGGAVPLPGISSFSMSEDQAMFSVKVNKKLGGNTENIDKFVNSLGVKIKDHRYLQKMLAHTLTSEDCEAARGPVQEPLMRMLLNVECIQTKLIELLLNRVVDCIVDNKAESENAQLVSSILGQMRFLCKANDMKMASRLFEIIEAAAINIKREIIFLLPEIIPEEEAEEVCTQLIEMLKFDEILTNVIIDALTNLPLTLALRTTVCSKILQRLDKCPLEFLPSLVQFVLSKCQPDQFNEVINGLRNNLPFSPQYFEMKMAESRKCSDEDSYVKLTFENLKFSMMASKEMTDCWMKIISSCNSSKSFRCVDLIVLIIFFSCLFGRKSQVLQVTRNKIKSAVLTRCHVENTFKILGVIAEEYSTTVLEIASVLLKSFEPKISSFGALLYRQCFSHFRHYARQIVISEILLHVGTGPPATVNTSLCALKDLCESEKEALSEHVASIMGLLVKVADLDLMQVRLLMEVIGDLLFSGPLSKGTAAHDELQMFIRKQLTSSKSDQCKKGVLAAIVFGKHSQKEADGEDTNCAQSNSLLELAMGSNGTWETKRGYFNDEFATMAKESRLKKSFRKTWSKKAFGLVMEILFVQDVDVECADFPTSAQYPLHDEDVQKLVLPAVEFTSSGKSSANASVPLIPSTLRLFWCLEGNMQRLLPAFYASVIMPEATAYENFNSFDECQKTKIMDCLFLCGNYLIECVNALCAHGTLDKAVLRVKQLISVRKLIARLIGHIPDFVPPLCQFYTPAQRVCAKKKVSEKKPRKGRKRKLSQISGEASSSFVESQRPEKNASLCPGENAFPAEHASEEADLAPYSSFFRELDFLTNELLATDFDFDPDSETFRMAKTPRNSVSPKLETCDVLFLLEDLIHKSENVLKSPEAALNYKSKPALLLIQRVTPEEFIAASVRILPRLLTKLERFSKYSEILLEANDWNYHSRGLFVDGACSVKLAMAAGLKFIANVISWKGFQNSRNDLLMDFLSIMAKRDKKTEEASQSLDPSEAVAVAAARYLATFGKTVLVLHGGLSIVRSYQTCLRYSTAESCAALADLCRGFLLRSWFKVTGAPDGGAVYNQHVDVLLRIYFSHAEDKLETVRVSAKMAFDEVGGLAGRESTLKTFKTINKSNFPLLYRTICEALVTASAGEFSNAGDDHEKQLRVCNKVVETLLILVETAKIHSSRVILASLLKRSQSIIQLFLSKGMPVVESALRVKSVQVLTLLKSFQMVTRFLHSICCQSRITNDSVVAAHVPAIRSLCERLTLEVKGMLILNGIPMDCITIAILKNRDIKGNDIISQETFDGESDDDDDSELPPEDTPDAEENWNESANGEVQGTDSETY